MSRIGKKLIEIPNQVEVKIERNTIFTKGPKGELKLDIHRKVNVVVGDNQIKVDIKSNDKLSRSLFGLTRSLIANMITGVSQGYSKKLEVIGVGYKVQLNQDELILNVGYSHPITIYAPKGITFSVHKNTITVAGIDKQLVGEIAAQIRKVRKPEPYKGKGIRYYGEKIKRKVGKAAKTGTTA